MVSPYSGARSAANAIRISIQQAQRDTANHLQHVPKRGRHTAAYWASVSFRPSLYQGKTFNIPYRNMASSLKSTAKQDSGNNEGSAFLFPGQGAQTLHMTMNELHLPAVQEMYTKAKDILGYDLQEACTPAT